MSGWGIPTPYPDELGCSVLARFTKQWYGVDHRGLLEAVTGAKFGSWHPACVSKLRKIAEACYPSRKDAVWRFVRRNTLLSYAMAFDPPDRRARALALINEGNGRFAQAFGLSHARHGWPRTMRLCADCLQGDLTGSREPYWRRTHHLPGIRHCLRHGTVLHETSLRFAHSDASALITPHLGLCAFRAETEVPAIFSRSLERSLIAPSLDALSGRPMPATASARKHYRKVLSELGADDGFGNLKFSTIETTFVKWLQEKECQVKDFGRAEWLRPMLTGVPGVPSSLQHLLLRAFLDDCETGADCLRLRKRIPQKVRPASSFTGPAFPRIEREIEDGFCEAGEPSSRWPQMVEDRKSCVDATTSLTAVHLKFPSEISPKADHLTAAMCPDEFQTADSSRSSV